MGAAGLHVSGLAWPGLTPCISISLSKARLTATAFICASWQTATALAEAPAAEMAMELFLAAAQAASEEARLEMVAYEMLEQVRLLAADSCSAACGWEEARRAGRGQGGKAARLGMVLEQALRRLLRRAALRCGRGGWATQVARLGGQATGGGWRGV